MGNKNTIGLLRYSSEKKAEMEQRLENSMQKLLFEMPYKKISISLLCADADVSRMAYYAHFTSKDQILERLVVKMNNDLIETVGNPFSMIPDLPWYQRLFSYIDEKRELIRHLFEAGFYEKYLDILNDVITKHENLTEAEIIRRLTWNGGIVNVVKSWVNRPEISVDEIAKYCYLCLQQVFRGKLE